MEATLTKDYYNREFIIRGNINRQAYGIILNFFSNKDDTGQNSELPPFFQQIGKILKSKKGWQDVHKLVLQIFYEYGHRYVSAKKKVQRDTYQTENSRYLERLLRQREEKRKELRPYLQFQIICDRYVDIQKKYFILTLNVYIF